MNPFVCQQCRRPIGPTDLSLNGLHAECAREKEQRRMIQESKRLADENRRLKGTAANGRTNVYG